MFTTNFHSLRDSLSFNDSKSIIFVGDRVLLPKALRLRVLKLAHETHTGAEKMKQILKAYFYWPKMANDIDEHVRVCDSCIRFAPSNKPAPMKSTTSDIVEPWQKISIDITGPSHRTGNRTWLTIIDYYSRFPFVCTLRDISSNTVIAALKSLFAIFGIPKYLVSDNGGCFKSEQFENFLKHLGIIHYCSSVYYPQSNGVIERFHRTLKSSIDKLLFEKCPINEAVDKTLFAIRSTPCSATGNTPFNLFFGREMHNKFHLINDVKQIIVKERNREQEYKNRNERYKAKVVSFKSDDEVLVRLPNGTKHAKIISNKGHGSWLIEHDDGFRKVVNQKFLKLKPNRSCSR